MKETKKQSTIQIETAQNSVGEAIDNAVKRSCGPDGVKENGNENKNQAQQKPRKQKRLDPTRYGDWEKNGRCIDF